MLPSWAADLLDSLTFDALVAHGRDLVEYARTDWVGFTFWALVWTGSFCTTVLLLRMLFTRWGDTNVTRKTMAVSLLAHLVLALLSTRMVFSQPGPGGRGSGREVVIRPSRRTIIEGNQFPVGRSLHGTPVWERQPQFDRGRPSRVAKTDMAPVDHDSVVRQTTIAEQSPTLQLPDLPAAEATPPATPDPARGSDAPSTRATITHAPIAEETAGARAEAQSRAIGTQRAARTASLPPGPEPRRPSRAAEPEESREPLPPATSVVVAPIPTVSPSEIRRSPETNASRPNAAPAPTTDPVTDSEGVSPGTGTQSAATEKTFTRSGRRPSNDLNAGAVDRVRSGQATSLLDTGTSRLMASRSGSSEPFPEGMKPEVVRPDMVGAIDINAGKVPAPYRLRGLPQRKQFAIDMGATEESERAVEASLRWLAQHQHPQGYWQPIESTLGREPDENKFSDPAERQRSGLQAESGLTALALLAFLGANYTHEDNLYADNVERALRWLVAQQESDGFLGGRANKYAGMYCHGMATIALGEAYGMTKDSALREPLMRAIQHIIDRQNPTDGGWRYNKLQTGDMSMFGWQLMALKSAHTAGLKVPREPVQKAIEFLNTHSGEMRTRGLSRHGGLAAYRREDRPKPSMTAESLFCKQMLGLKRDDPSVAEALDYLQQNVPRRAQQDMYYWYYGTLAMYHHGGEPWRRWNKAMRDNLVTDQRTDGDFAGSWNPRAPWGDYGGRVFSTALSTLCLEVYYRFLPLYQMSGKPEETAVKK